VPPRRLIGMAHAWRLALLALAMVTTGCFGGTASRQPHTRPYAAFHVSGTYAGARARFTIACRSPRDHLGPDSIAGWKEELCRAILDYRTRMPTPTGILYLGCPPSVGQVDVRGTIGSRPMHQWFTSCLCGDGPRAAADVRIILRTHPPFRTPAK